MLKNHPKAVDVIDHGRQQSKAGHCLSHNSEQSQEAPQSIRAAK